MVTGIYFVGGFGVMGWIAAEDYESARPDPLADAAAGIIQHQTRSTADSACSSRVRMDSSVPRRLPATTIPP
jgi:hypothetical protein